MSLGIAKDSSDCFWQSSVFFLYRQYRKNKNNIKINKNENKNKTSTKLHRRNHHPKHVFSWFSLNPRTIDPPTNQLPTTYPLTHRLPTQQLTESIIIFGRLNNRSMSILQNKSTTGKTYNHIILRHTIQKVY